MSGIIVNSDQTHPIYRRIHQGSIRGFDSSSETKR